MRMTKRTLRSILPALLLGGVVSVVTARGTEATHPEAEQAAQHVLRDDWMGVYLLGKKVGVAHVCVLEKTEDGRRLFETRSFQKISVQRGIAGIEMVQSSSLIEDEDGRLVRFDCQVKEMKSKRHIVGRVVGDRLEYYAGASPEPTWKSEQFDAEGRCPYWLERQLKQKKLSLEDGVAIRMWFPDMSPSKPLRTRLKGRDDELVEIFGGKRRLRRVEMTIEALAGMVFVNWYDDEGTTWRCDLAGALPVKFLKMDKEFAESPSEPLEMLSASYVSPDRRIANPRRVVTARYRITARDGTRLPEFPEGVGQEVKKEGENSILVRIRLPGLKEGGAPQSEKLPDELGAYLEASPLLEKDNPELAEAARQACEGRRGAPDIALALQNWVNAHVQSKNLSIGFGSALETLKQAEGDCTEHAVLCAALARSLGIPSRVVAGLVYMPKDSISVGDYPSGAFGYHLWTEVYVGEWKPIDSAIRPPDGSPVDATHIAMARSALGGPMPLELCGPIIAAGAAIRIEVLEVEEAP